MMDGLSVPVVLIVFNRPELTKRIAEIVRDAKPSQLYVVADGPRIGYPNEKETCDSVRSVIDTIEWDCPVFKSYADENMGCQKRVYSGLNWVFSKVESAIILEDDCLAHPSFFHFCDELLHLYKNDERIAVISGNNFQFGRQRTKDSYYFSRYPHCWGWATWRRAWGDCDIEMEEWPEMRRNGFLEGLFARSSSARYWSSKFQSTYDKKVDSWSFPWTFSCWSQSRLTILPEQNLVTNIGFCELGTHHRNNKTPFANMKVFPMKFPLKHPKYIVRDSRADSFTQSYQFGFIARAVRKILSLLP